MKKKLIAGAVGAAALAAVSLAPSANAYGSTHITSYVSWLGADCVAYDYPSKNGYYTMTGTTCAPSQITVADYYASPGEIVGADPVMGAASWIHCSLYLNEVLNYESWANAGDGHDANCLRTLTG